MAKRSQAPKVVEEPAIPDSFAPEALYNIRVGRSCQAFNADFSPAHAATVKGKVAEAIREHLVSAEPI